MRHKHFLGKDSPTAGGAKQGSKKQTATPPSMFVHKLLATSTVAALVGRRSTPGGGARVMSAQNRRSKHRGGGTTSNVGTHPASSTFSPNKAVIRKCAEKSTTSGGSADKLAGSGKTTSAAFGASSSTTGAASSSTAPGGAGTATTRRSTGAALPAEVVEESIAGTDADPDMKMGDLTAQNFRKGSREEQRQDDVDNSPSVSPSESYQRPLMSPEEQRKLNDWRRRLRSAVKRTLLFVQRLVTLSRAEKATMFGTKDQYYYEARLGYVAFKRFFLKQVLRPLGYLTKGGPNGFFGSLSSVRGAEGEENGRTGLAEWEKVRNAKVSYYYRLHYNFI